MTKADAPRLQGKAVYVAAILLLVTTWAAAPLSAQTVPTVLVQGGTFRMGDYRYGFRNVTVSSFLMASTETTFAQYDSFANATNRRLPEDFGWGRGDRPVIRVSWFDAVAFANWLSEQDGLMPAYTINGTDVVWNRSATGWRLPTEAEWEFAARGGTQSRGHTYAGSNEAETVAWYNQNSNGRTQPVGSKLANELGLHDLSGNVSEWVWDWDARYPANPESNPTGPASGSKRVTRGGAWFFNAASSSVHYRMSYHPTYNGNIQGFRLVRSAAR